MTTTNIQFNEKQNFETIKEIIELNFDNITIHKSIGNLEYISFNFKGQNIYCSFMKNNIIYGNNNQITECSSFSSDRPNKIKTQAFKIIAKNFKCRLWENDCNENKYIDFKIKNKVKPIVNCGYKSKTQTEKNIAWFLPRPKPDHYKGGMPLYCEDWLLDLARDILHNNSIKDIERTNVFTLNVFSGMNKRGVRVDLNPEVKPDVICDIHKLSKCEQMFPVGPRFDIILADPPYSEQEAKELYGTSKLNYKKWTSECDKFLKIGGLFMIYHKFVMPNPNPNKYEVVKRVFIGNRVMHLPRVCIIFQKKNN